MENIEKIIEFAYRHYAARLDGLEMECLSAERRLDMAENVQELAAAQNRLDAIKAAIKEIEREAAANGLDLGKLREAVFNITMDFWENEELRKNA